jgi:hypothetical protein
MHCEMQNRVSAMHFKLQEKLRWRRKQHEGEVMKMQIEPQRQIN